MDLEEVLHKLEEAKELKDWDMIEECIDAIRVLIDDFDEYNNEETWGWNGIDRCYSTTECSRDWVGLVTKYSQNQNGELSLQGLEIDWHLANTEMGFDNFVNPVSDYQPTYANA